MVQPIDSRAIYNAVKINIKKPEVNTGNNINSYTDDNGIYNGVAIDIDNPTVNTAPKRIYDYPQTGDIVTYDMANIAPVTLPQDFRVAYHTAKFIIPDAEAVEIEPEVVEPDAAEEIEDAVVDIPEPNYTTTQEENVEEISEEIAEESDIAPENNVEENIAPVELKKPEIIPGEEILPEVDVPQVAENLASSDYDIQAKQMEEIARVSLDDKENAVPYIVREIFSGLIDITKADSTYLAAPTDEQIAARSKVIENVLAMENSTDENKKPPYELSDEEIALAVQLSPMEMAERNKEYALTTIAILSKIYTDEVERQTGNIVPLTDIPGSAAIADSLRFSPNPGVKVVAIDALQHIYRPEYKEELTTMFTLAQSDANPQVAKAATDALDKINN